MVCGGPDTPLQLPHERTSAIRDHPTGKRWRELIVGSFSIQLVAIGQGIDEEAIRKLLMDCVAVEDNNSPMCDVALYSDAKSCLANDPRFEILEERVFDPQSGQAVTCTPQANYIDFRVTGVIEYSVSVEEASTIHGIDFNCMNRELVKRVNGSSLPVCLLPVQLLTALGYRCVDMPLTSTHPSSRCLK